MQGRRRKDGTSVLDLEEGDYCKRGDTWWGRPPGTHKGDIANLANHDIEEHLNGSITVQPSILLQKGDGKSGLVEAYHGFLENGVWS